MINGPLKRLRDQRGAAAVELTLLVPALLLTLGLLVAGGRLWFAPGLVAGGRNTPQWMVEAAGGAGPESLTAGRFTPVDAMTPVRRVSSVGSFRSRATVRSSSNSALAPSTSADQQS